MNMSHVGFDKSRASQVWIALRRLDRNDDRVMALREVSIPAAADVTMVIQIIKTTFGLNLSDVIFKASCARGDQDLSACYGSVFINMCRYPRLLLSKIKVTRLVRSLSRVYT
ncbi:hypothetical protein F2P81_004702 [Scophthalmus maximus]|uniref:Uncharacterized protein n=1 Tax=Scophthalmus maximus TaxID=52904 RepID=A0A6A4TDX0_SCOMX|nr:hypothetical protein F2P81_004702 [Scophthalmus maximus]